MKPHPRDILVGAQAGAFALPVCDHYSGAPARMRKSLQLQAELTAEFGACVFDVTLDCEDGAPVGGEAEHAALVTELALAALTRLGIAQVADVSPTQLPPGMLRLAEIARAIAGSPSVLLLDEPAAGLNSVETRDLSNALKKLRGPKLVLVVVEHDMDLIMDVCDTIHVLNVGRLLASGAPAHIQANPDVVRVYLGDDDE